MYKLKQIDLLVSKKITDKALSVEKIIKQPAYIDLAPELKRIKEAQNKCSSFRGGSFEEIFMRIETRCRLDKELEDIQSKIEIVQYKKMLKLNDNELQLLNTEILALRNSKNAIERDISRNPSGSNENKIKSLNKTHEKTEHQIVALEHIINKYKEAQSDYIEIHNKVIEIQNNTENIQNKIDETNNLLKSLSTEISPSVSNKEIIENLKSKLPTMQLEKEKLNNLVKKLEADMKRIAGLCENENMSRLDNIINMLKKESLEISNAFVDRVKIYKDKAKKNVVMRLKAKYMHCQEYAFNLWKCKEDYKKCILGNLLLFNTLDVCKMLEEKRNC